ncbi:UDP-2,4-diacetamido-2,4,6-trideoxy-beta-L-altropyranose hydrolase [Pseudomonas japonica]|uniref:UDP-2,4-diacetamido-2,4,6-trideoxy-beta-L-altropyranose hydrolase n=1 Tax=Pseudomonas japonica TaxID=256466 RepID=A0A239DJB3_9PSED|nr:UDP-2,4-diacetamido-2,4,6-trideoxy-beta-L-altropyranose hydrolase [Pseudomonas japonica]SNS32329.1 UDP-2,4-diacetamido-2,4,6-trideoxy-beta-L-altropyranose hydrolase [Pseudomonas japonica]
MNLLFRVDAGSSLGIGHVARCLTLAAELVACGAKVAFACRELVGHQMARIAAAGHEVFALSPDTADEMLALRAVLPQGAFFDWIVVDHYQLDATWETAARQWARRIMAIDDLADRPHACDLLLDQNFTASAALYQALLPGTCHLLAGPRYALLRPAFRREREATAETARRVLVSFGGFDQAGMTLKTLRALAGIERVAVQCIAGQASADLAALRALVEQQPGWQLLAFVDDLAERMGAATLFIGAGGGTTWERAAMGLPSLCVSVADNQVANAQALARAGVHRYLGDAGQATVDGLRQAITVLLDNAPLRQQFAARSRQLVDGLGARRVAVALLTDHLQAECHFERVLKDSQDEQF